jgi:hypothetical protein
MGGPSPEEIGIKPENKEGEPTVEQLQREVDTLKRSMTALMGSMREFTRMLFNSGGRGLDEYPKRDVIFSLEKTMEWAQDQIQNPTSKAEYEDKQKTKK